MAYTTYLQWKSPNVLVKYVKVSPNNYKSNIVYRRFTETTFIMYVQMVRLGKPNNLKCLRAGIQRV